VIQLSAIAILAAFTLRLTPAPDFALVVRHE
jgi:hypothetical protein